MTRYFPELVEAVKANLPGAVRDRRRDRDRRTRRPPAGLRGAAAADPPGGQPGARCSPSRPRRSFVAFDLLALGDDDLHRASRSRERRAALEEALAGAAPPVHLTPATTDRDLAEQWFEQFEGAGLDGLIAKPLDGTYQPDKRVMFKIKHERTADCVVAGYRLHKSGPDAIGSLLLGLYTDAGDAGHRRRDRARSRWRAAGSCSPSCSRWSPTFDGHPWNWAQAGRGATRHPARAPSSRWNAGKDLSFVPLRPERVVEVRYDHMEGGRFRHTAQFVRWRPDREPRSCTYAQLEEPVKYDLGEILGS